MKLLHANDEPGKHAPSWYQASCEPIFRTSLSRHICAEVCVIGAGYTGLAAAIELRRSGVDVVVLDAHRIGWGASGRNGGQLGSGFNEDQFSLAKTLGDETAKRLWGQCQEAKKWIHQLCKDYQIDIEYTPGIVSACHRKREVKSLHQYCNYLIDQYRYTALETLSADTIKQYVNSKDYHGGLIDHEAGHIHPLKLAIGMAKVAESLGATLYDRTEVLRITEHSQSPDQHVITAEGSIRCSQVIIATNGYVDDLQPKINSWVMPINNFIVVTEPLNDLANELLPQNNAVADSRFVVNYFRRVDGNRLLFGGGENYSYSFPKTINTIVKKAMLNIFPSLAGVKIDYAWGGTLAITRNRLPYVQHFQTGRYFAGGYSGHGVALASLYGRAIAEHITGDPERLQLLQRLPAKRFPGGPSLRPMMLALAMTGYSWLDRL